MTKEGELKKYFAITTERMFTALESFHLWKRLSQMRNINESGLEAAERYVSILNKYWDFFHPVMISSYKSFVIDLSIFFDAEKHQDTFSLGKLLELVSNKISDEEFETLVTEIKEIKRKHGVRISFILELRNREVGHQELERQERQVMFRDLEELFIGVQEILNLVNGYADGSYTIWDHIPRNTEDALEWVIDNLERGEQVRMGEIERMYPI